MGRTDYDVIIVGARCAGAALGTFLARAGASVLLLERDATGSEYVLSTHLIHPAGMNVLDEVGVGDAVRATSPPMGTLRLRRRDAVVDVELTPAQYEYCPRRARLDGLLQQAAIEAGASLHDRTRVTDVLRDGGRVCGVRARDAAGTQHTIRAPLVVGADGRGSTVASLVGADAYHAYDATRATYWGYWPAPRGRTPLMYNGCVAGHSRVAFSTDHGHVLVSSAPPLDEAMGWRADPLAALRRNLADDPETADLVAGPPAEPIRGFLKTRYFFRQGAGAGWALVGDAGVHQEFVTGNGISEALSQARGLARAVAAGSDAALTRWWRARDVAALPWFCFGKDQGALGERPALDALVMERLRGTPECRERLAASLEHRVSPYDVVKPGQVLRWIGGALLRGRFGLVPEFAAMGARRAEVGRTVEEARRLLAREEPRAASNADPTTARLAMT